MKTSNNKQVDVAIRDIRTTKISLYRFKTMKDAKAFVKDVKIRFHMKYEVIYSSISSLTTMW